VSDQPTVLVADAHESADRIAEELTREGMIVERVDGLEACLARLDAGGIDVLLLALDGKPDTYAAVRSHPSDLPVVVIAEPGEQERAEAAVRSGAEDRITRGELPDSMVPRLLRHAMERHRLRRELRALEIVDEATGLPNLRGFAPIAEHHLRMADRAGEPVIFVFVRIEEHDALRAALGSEAADELARDAAGVVLNSVRDSDVPGRIAPDTFCILLTGEAEGAETTVLSRLVEAMAVHDARRDRPRALKLSVGTARYEPGSGLHLAELLEGAIRRLGRAGGA
jgi:diguanylate cyclase (GGDEF)-like protein